MAKNKKVTSNEVSVNCLRQNCYLRAVTPIATASKAKPVKKYYELQEKQVRNGLIYELVECDYPITKESVKSYESSTSYKNDPDGAVRTNQKNLGDITEIQKVLQDDARNFMETYTRVTKELEAYKAKEAQSKTSDNVKEASDESKV